jgi:two-component system, NtrC family, response regulator HydG
MEPRLVILCGAKKGATARIGGAEMTIGRDPLSGLCINEESISRKHCAISLHDSTFRIVDFNSRNGTFVNGIPIHEKVLTHGDTIRLGHSEMLFLLNEEVTEQEERNFAAAAEADRTMVISGTQLRLEVGLSAPDIGSLVRDFNALLKLSRQINTISNSELLQRELLEIILDVVPAERGYVIITARGGDPVTVGRLRDGRKASPQELNWKIINRALWESCNVVNEAEAAGRPEGSQQLVLCVPLNATRNTIGVIYLVAASDAAFQENHVQFVSSAAGIFAIAFENVMQKESLEDENSRLRTESAIEQALIGETAAMVSLMGFISRAAPTDSTVLIRGESGTGKELVARAIHQNSPRRDNPFVAINCAAITETLLESELFGHEKGAFTGATSLKKGRLEIANSGTLFLDEIGEMPLTLQAKLLRVLQNREFERVGSTRPMRVDARFVAATNRELEKAIQAGAFRQDLFYRLNVVSVTVPPLRAHRDDIPLLAMYFAAESCKKCKRPPKGISPQARALLMGYSWPGNVRELENAIERAVVLGVGDTIMPEDLPEPLLESQPEVSTGSKYHRSLNALKKQLILDAIEQGGGMITEAAKILGVHPNYLHRLIRNLQVRTQKGSAA